MISAFRIERESDSCDIEFPLQEKKDTGHDWENSSDFYGYSVEIRQKEWKPVFLTTM